MYVRPTSNMIVHPNHAQVDKEGMVYLPYLADWHAHAAAGNLDASPMGGRGGYNLSELLVLAASVFSEHPPLFTRPPTAVPVQTSPVALGTAAALSSSFSASSGSIHAASSHTPHAQRPAARSQREILEEQLTARLQVCLCHEVYYPSSCLLFPDSVLLPPCLCAQRGLRDAYTRLRADLDKEFAVQKELEASKATVGTNIATLAGLKGELGAAVRDLERRAEGLEKWAKAEDDAAAQVGMAPDMVRV
jgi:hypothetical protein